MARVLRAVFALQALDVTSGSRRASGGAEEKLEFPVQGLSAVAAVIGQGAKPGGPLPRAPAPAPSAPGATASLQSLLPGAHRDGLRLFAGASPFDKAPDSWNYNLVDIRKIKEGREATIYSARLRHNRGQSVAVKRVVPQHDVEAVHKEIHYLQKFSHAPEIVTLYRTANAGNIVPGEEVLLLMELAIGNLKELAVTKTFAEVTLETRIKLVVDIVRAVRVLERAYVAHHNLTPENVLIVGERDAPETWSAVLCDTADMCTYPDSTGADFMLPSDVGAATNADYKALGDIIWSLITQGNPSADHFLALEPHTRFKEYNGNTEAMEEMLEVWMAINFPGQALPTQTLLDRLHEVAERHNIDVSRRQRPKLIGWSNFRSFLRRLIAIPMIP